MVTIVGRLRRRVTRILWDVDPGSLGSGRRILIRFLRFAYVIARELAEGQLTLRAMSLVYTTLLSLVPLLAVSFSVLKAFGVHNQVEPVLQNFLRPLGPQGEEIGRNIIAFVENMKVGVLGSIGLALLIYTVIALIRKIESTFNYIWRVRRTRSLAQAFSNYLSVLLIGPVLVFAAIGITASIKSTAVMQALISIEPFGTAAYLIGRLIPYLLICAAFTFFNIFVPNTVVRFRAALAGGVFAGVLWEVTGWAFASFVVTSTKYEAIYSGFAIVIMFMIWLYVSWLILLIGAQIAFYYQHPQRLAVGKASRRTSRRHWERLGLAAMFLVAENYHRGGGRLTVDVMAQRLGIDAGTVQDMLEILEAKGLVVETRDEPPCYLPERDIETITLREIYDIVRNDGGMGPASGGEYDCLSSADRLLERADQAVGAALGEETLKDFIRRE